MTRRKSMTAVLTNNFHNSQAVVRCPLDGWLSASQVRRVRRKLCGVSGCTCGDEIGMRGSQNWTIDDFARESDPRGIGGVVVHIVRREVTR